MLSTFVPTRSKFRRHYLEADLRRLLQSLQNFDQVAPFSTLLAAFASFHSTAHFFWRSRAASCPALGSFFVLCIFVGRSCLLLRGSGRKELRHRRNDKSDRKRGGEHGFRHGFHFPLFPKARGAVGRQSAAVRNRRATITRIGCIAPSCDRMTPLQAAWLRNTDARPRSGRLGASGLKGAHYGAR